MVGETSRTGGAAGHAKRDVPEAVAAAAARSGIRVRQTDPFGELAEIVDLARHRCRQAVAGLATVSPAETVLVMVGRGSSDPAAVAQLQSFTESMLADDPEGRPRRVELGFVAAARPRHDRRFALLAEVSAEIRRQAGR